jgi:hypothetical protein
MIISGAETSIQAATKPIIDEDNQQCRYKGIPNLSLNFVNY